MLRQFINYTGDIKITADLYDLTGFGIEVFLSKEGQLLAVFREGFLSCTFDEANKQGLGNNTETICLTSGGQYELDIK